MRARLRYGLILFTVSLCWTGCFQNTGSLVDEEKSPYLIAGRDWVAAHDYDKAMKKFQKALEVNPRSALAHYELGLLNEQHLNDYVSAIYHYQRALQVRPNDYPADNARVRIASCKQELVKEESLAPVAQAMLRELEELRKENTHLRQELQNLRSASANRKSTPTQTSSPTPAPPAPTRVSRLSPPPARGTTRSHIVRAGETPFSISQSYRISLQAFLKANPSLQPRHMPVGKRVNIPSP